MRRLVGGQRVTYVKRRQNKRFLWSFKLTTEKAWELRAFVQEYGSQRIQILDWNNQMYYAYIKSNPIEFNHAERDAKCLEVVEVTLEWEGYLIPPHEGLTLNMPEEGTAVNSGYFDGLFSITYNFSFPVSIVITSDNNDLILTFGTITGLSVTGNGSQTVTLVGPATRINAAFALNFAWTHSNLPVSPVITITAQTTDPAETITKNVTLSLS